jgi:hypothetical protein
MLCLNNFLNNKDLEDRTIGVLRSDLSNLCIELQREHATSQTLQKSLGDMDHRHEELKSLLSKYLATTTSNMAGHENNYLKLLSAAAGNGTKYATLPRSRPMLTFRLYRLDVCLASIHDIKESELKSRPKLGELQRLVDALSAKYVVTNFTRLVKK